METCKNSVLSQNYFSDVWRETKVDCSTISLPNNRKHNIRMLCHLFGRLCNKSTFCCQFIAFFRGSIVLEWRGPIESTIVALYPCFIRLRHIDFPITPIPTNPILVFSGFMTKQYNRKRKMEALRTNKEYNLMTTGLSRPTWWLCRPWIFNHFIHSPTTIELLSLGNI